MLQFFIAAACIFAAVCVILSALLVRARKNARETRLFLSSAAHDICSPLANIKGFSDALRDGIIPENKKDETLALISDEAERISRLASNLAGNTSKGEASVFGICHVLSRTVVLFEQRAQQRNISVNFSFPDDEIYLKADKDAVSEAVYNLYSNAVKYCDEGGNITVSASVCGAKCRISIKNTGYIGVDEEKKIFAPGYRAKSSKGTEGMGLGLYIAAKIAAEQGSKLVLETSGGCCEFSFELDVAE